MVRSGHDPSHVPGSLSRRGILSNAEAADRYINAVFRYAVKPNGLLVWGSHIFYDAYGDRAGGDGPHEILVYRLGLIGARNKMPTPLDAS